MANDKPFQPEFGPNGAVLNAPSMTPEMRAKFDQIGKIPPLAVLWREAWRIVPVLAVIFGVLWFGEPARQFLLRSPWWAGAFTGMVTVLAVWTLWGFIKQALSGWEIVGGKTRVLTAPLWVRLTLFATYVVAAAMAIGNVVVLAATLDFQIATSISGGWGLALVALYLHLFLKWLAERRGWIVKPA